MTKTKTQYVCLACGGITTKWQDAQTRNELTMAQVAQIHKALGVPDEQNWMTLGFTPQEKEGFRATQRANQAANVAARGPSGLLVGMCHTVGYLLVL